MIARGASSKHALHFLLQTQAKMLPGQGMFEQGINVQSDAYASRATLLQSIEELADKSGLVLIRAPPMTGKTSTWTLLNNFLNIKGDTVSFRMAPVGFGQNFHFEHVFKSQIGIGWDLFSKLVEGSELKVDLLVDEAQVHFWNRYSC